MKKLLVFIFALLLVMPLMSAVPPVQVSTATTGFDIFVPQISPLKFGEDYNLHLHISNKTNGYPLLNTQASCYTHLYSTMGSHIFEGQMGLDSNGEDFKLDVDKGNFSYNGQYSFYIWCNNSAWNLGGEAKGVFYVNPTGVELSEARAILYVGFIILLFVMFVSSLAVCNHLPKDKRDEEGSLLSISYLKHLKYALWIFSYFMAIVILFISANICLAYLGQAMLGGLFFKLYQILFALSPLLIIVMLLSFFSRLNTDKEFKAMLNRGMLPGKV